MRFTVAYRLAGLLIAAPVAVVGHWSLAEFCWSTWLAGLLFTWTCILTGGVQILATAPKWRPPLERHLPARIRLSRASATAIVVVGAACLMAVAFYVYTFAFGLYGLLLSFFAEMEPHVSFGRNGFINSDFWTPVRDLITSFWAMSAGTIVAYGQELIRSNPWSRMLLPLTTEVVRVHIMVVAMPFIALAAWAIFGESYQLVAVVLLMIIFYLLPSRSRQRHVRTTAERIPA